MMGEVMTPLPPGTSQGRGKPVGGGHERENLRYIIQQWNANRLDLFEISEPDENLEFHGVMRFYFQDSGQKVATKCIRVGSSSTTKHVIATLVQKFRPDMRMLSAPSYLLYEIHENGEERRLADDEKPLLVQLNWNKDDREGRFLLRRVDFGSKVPLPPLESLTAPPADTNGSTNFIRKLSRREKKDLKKQEKQRRAAEDDKNSVAEKLYTELPETSFTRSISNPEAVMRRRRAQKLEKKLQQFRSKDGGPDTGGTLKIYGSSLCPDVPYKTLLLSVTDTAQSVVKEMLEKYGLLRENPIHYCLIQAVVTAEEAREGYEGPVYPQKEYVLDDDECPLAILMNHSTATGSIMFHVRRRSVDQVGGRKRKKKPLKGTIETGADAVHQTLPLLVELGIEGNELTSGNHHRIQPNVTEVGSERAPHGNSSQILQLFGPDVHPRHCVIALTDGVVTVTPCNREAESSINGCRIYETTILRHGCIVRFGRQHAYRFVDPQADPRLSSQFTSGMQQPQQPHIASPQPTPIPTMPQQPQWGQEAPRFQPTRDPILPAVIEFREECEESFFRSITTALDPTHVQFKLAPTYVLYMAARFRASTHYRTDLAPLERAKRLTMMLTKVAHLLQTVVQSRPQDAVWLSFWLANSSELLHFLKHDRHISGYSVDAQDRLADLVQISFRSLVVSMQSEMEAALPLLLEDRNDSDEEEGCTAHVLSILTNTMALLRRCRVNAALTIQLFSQLFHFLSTWAFNRVVTNSYPNYCSRVWGHRLRLRLSRIEVWAEKQGLELAADCHLAKLSQAAILLTSPKSSTEDIASISSGCFKLNSLQLGAILEQYLPQGDEPPIPYELKDSVVAVAESTADGLAREDGKEVTLQEDYDLQLPFILPEDGYSCDIVRGVPSGLLEFMTPLQNAGLCRMNPQPSSSGYWTIYMHGHENSAPTPMGVRSPSVMSSRSVTRGEPEVQTLHLQKTSQGMGLSIVATRGLNQDQLGIYIKSVVPGGSADQDGRLQAGDQLISVDGRSLVGISQERAAEYMKRTGSTVVLEVAKQGAFYHGLATVLEQPSPTARPGGPHGNGPHRYASERDLSGPKMVHHNQMMPPPQHYRPQIAGGGYPPQHMQRMQPAKSVPALNTGEVPLSELGKSSSHDQGHDHQPQQLFMPPYGQQQQHHHNNRSRSTQNLSSEQSIHDDRHYQNVAFHHSPNTFPHPQSRPASALLHRGESDRPDLYRPSSQRDLRPHEPKLVHLPEEVEMPPPAPKPRPQARGMDTQLYRDSPPPPPPPASTHPLLVGGNSPGSAPPNRQGGVQFNKNSAWEREEKERYDQRRREAARQWRDEQIRALEMQPERTPQESARLETLTLEREFELRARQANDDEEDEEDSVEEEQLKTSDVSNEMPSPPRPNLPRGGPGFMSPPVVNGGSLMAPKFEENKVKRQDEIRRKQQELEAASEAELKILREAQRRQEEENVIRSSTRQHATQRLDTLVSPSKMEYSNGGHPVNGVRGYEPMLNNNNPKPPERHSSFGVINHQTNNSRPEYNPSPGPNSNKRVQFSENTQINTSYDYNANEGLSPTKQIQSADAFITEAESMLNFSPSPIRNPITNNTVDTPGVIGAQEVYRDPRVRRLQEKQALQAATSNKPPVPETLTFREKMKMFAAETGENNTPKDKTKISRAQRDID